MTGPIFRATNYLVCVKVLRFTRKNKTILSTLRVNNFRVIFVNAIKKKKDEKAFLPLKQLLSLFHPFVVTTPSPQKKFGFRIVMQSSKIFLLCSNMKTLQEKNPFLIISNSTSKLPTV
jgi:hypothetical protein